MRGAGDTNLIDNDAARHAMNGVLIHDLVRDVRFTDPIEYARYYYARLPAISLPYHAPLFPLVESLFFFALGVNVLAARLAVATAVAICVVLYYRLVLATHDSLALALVCTVTFFSLPVTQLLASDVMLEFPALVFVLASLHSFHRSRGLAFALLAAAAVWTKQAVFLGLVPFGYILLAGRWRWLRSRTIWISSAIFGASVIALFGLSLLLRWTGWTGVNQDWPHRGPVEMFLNHWSYYTTAVGRQFGVVPALTIALALTGSLLAPRWRQRYLAANDLYLSWFLAVLLVLFLIQGYDHRYLFFAYPAFIVAGYTVLFHLLSRLISPERIGYVQIAVAGLWLVAHLIPPATLLRGPAEAARILVSAGSPRVLYCGEANGSFIFTVRTLDPRLRTIVVRGDKLPESTFTPENLESFAHRYGIHHLVLERSKEPAPWDRFRASPLPSMVLERTIPSVASQKYLNSDLMIYRFTNPSPHPENVLKSFSRVLGREWEVRF